MSFEDLEEARAKRTEKDQAATAKAKRGRKGKGKEGMLDLETVMV